MSLITDATQKIARSPGDPQVIESGPSSIKPIDRAGRALGWFSLGLGAVEIFSPKTVTQALGVEGKEGFVRAMGFREVASGVLCLSANNDYGAFSRVGGDMLDLAALGSAYRDDNPKKRNVGIAIAAVTTIAVVDAVVGASIRNLHKRKSEPRDFSDRSGFPKGIDFSRGKAAGEIPKDYKAAPAAASASRPTGEATPAARAIEGVGAAG